MLPYLIGLELYVVAEEIHIPNTSLIASYMLLSKHSAAIG